MCQIWTILPVAPDVQVSPSSVVTWRHFSELQTFSQTAAAQVHPQCHSNICDCCSLRWIQRQWFSALSQAHAYPCGWHCESDIFGPQCWSSLPRYGYIYIWMHDRLATWLHSSWYAARPNAQVLQMAKKSSPHKTPVFFNRHCLNVCEQIRKTQAEPQWIVAQRLLSALTIPGFT